MTSRANRLGLRDVLRAACAPALLCAFALGGAATLSGCKEEEPPPPPPPPRRVEPQKVDAQSFVTDPRVTFPQAHAPTDESLARSIGEFAGALASGDAARLDAMLDASGKALLGAMRASGQFESETNDIEAVRVVMLDASESAATLHLAVQDQRGAYLTGWRATRQGDRWVFSGAPSPADTAQRAAQLDSAASAD